MKDQGVDLIDVSSGGVVPTRIEVKPMYQVPFSETIRSVNVLTGAVGLITKPEEALTILNNNQADLIFIGRELLRNPYFIYHCAKQLNIQITAPNDSYRRGWYMKF